MNNEEGIKFVRDILKATGDDANITDEEAMEIVRNASEPAADNWDNIVLMIEDIREYAKNNGRRIVNEDRPLEFRVAFRCAKTGKTWSVLMENINTSLQPADTDDQAAQTKKELIKACLPSQGGRLSLLHFLNAKS